MTWERDKTLFALSFFATFFTLVVLLIAWWKPEDVQFFSLFSGMLTTDFGALMMYLTKAPAALPPPDTKTTTNTQIESETKTPPATESIVNAPPVPKP